MAEQKTRPEEYWLAIDPMSPRFAEAVMEHYRGGIERLRGEKRHNRIQRAWRKYYSRGEHGYYDSTEVQPGGERGEVLDVATKRFNRVIRDTIALVVQTPPDYEPMALNTDATSQAQSLLVKGILQWYKMYAHLELVRVEHARMALLATEGFRHIRWDPTSGQAVKKNPQTGKLSVVDGPSPYLVDSRGKELYQGDYVWSVRSPYECVYDRTSPDRGRPRWYIVKEPANRYDLLAEYAEDFKKRKDGKELKQAILDAPAWTTALSELGYEDVGSDEFDDAIAVHYVYGERCSALPHGVKAVVLNDQFTLQGAHALNEPRAPVLRLSEEDVIMLGHGHSSAHDGMALDDVHSAQFSTILTNHDNFGGQRVLADRRTDMRKEDIEAAFSVVWWNGWDVKKDQPVPKPEPFPNVEGSGELLRFLESVSGEIDIAMGGSSYQRGDPNAVRGDSGSKVAAMLSAVQMVSNAFLQAVLNIDSEEASFLIGSLRRHATVERIVMIAGEKQAYNARTYVGEDLDQIPRVGVRRPNPARDTFSGRSALADMILRAPDEKIARAVESLIVTGKIDPMIEDDEQARIHLQRENQQLIDVAQDEPIVDKAESHLDHYRSHSMALCNPDVRMDPKLRDRVERHRQAHLDALTMGHENFAGDAVLMATGQRPIGHIDQATGQFLPGPPAGTPPRGGQRPPAPGAGGPGAEAPPGGPPGRPPGPPPRAPGSPPSPIEGNQPRMPAMPKAPGGQEQERPIGMDNPAGQ